jgi:Ran GTPase-activating protein (RanGAP) involved in mRNA processing and transport
MESAFDRGICGIKALKADYEEVTLELLKATTYLETLEKFNAEEVKKMEDFHRENNRLDEKLEYQEIQETTLDQAIKHYREAKK